MAPRLSKRQQREQEELEALASTSRQDADEVSEDEPIVRNKTKGPKRSMGFAALAGDDDEQEAEQVSDVEQSVRAIKSKKSKKKKKKGVGTTVDNDHPAATTKKPTPKSGGQEDVKSKAKLKVEEEDFDKALAELSGKYAASHLSGSSTAMSGSTSSFDAFNSLLSVSLKHLDPETELRRFFGSKVITASGASRPSRIRSHLARPQPAWPPAQYRAGLSMRALTPEEVQEKETGVGPDHRERWWTIEASPRYKGTTYEYLQCVMGGDPQLFYSLMYEMPWHADTLLQMAEVFRHREEYSTAADFMSRALFAYERAFAGAFNLTTGIHRLDFDRVENRVFFLALARNVIDLNRRGTPRTAFEFARLLYGLDPHTDPHGALLHLDYLAIKAKQGDWLLDLWDAYAKMDVDREGEVRFDVTILPGWCWARALALFEKEGELDEEHRESTQALKDAIVAFPSIAPLLADKVDITIPGRLRNTDAFRIVTDYSPHRHDLPTSLIQLLSHIYTIRSSSMWKIPTRAVWLRKTLTALSPSSLTPSVTSRPRIRFNTLFSTQSNITEAIYRHVVVVAPLSPEFRRLMSFFPDEAKTRLTLNIEGDPLPPVTAVSKYDDAYFLGVVAVSPGGVGSGRDAMAQRLRRAFPEGFEIDRAQLQALFDAHPEIAARFPEGMVELAQLARQFPREILEAVLGVMAQDGGLEAAPVEDGRMPGGEAILAEPDEERMEDEEQATAAVAAAAPEGDSGDAEESGHDEPFLPVRIVRNLIGRLWGRNVAEEGASGSDSDPERDETVDAGAAGGGGPRADDVD
ncbi:DUF654-domain-containing protein [Ramaria rubella]|nr:DUF654-domain-containing protein [Ramaria rubella]